MVVGIGFLIFGIAGLIPMLTLDISAMRAAGRQAEAALEQTFQVSAVDTAVRLLYGIAGVLAASRSRAATLYLLIGGVGLWLYGLAVRYEPVGNLVPGSTGAYWLPFVIGTAMVCLAFILQFTRRRDRSRDRGAAA